MATKATFNLADANATFDRVAFSVEVNVPVTDEWLQDVQNYFAANLPPGVAWSAVYKFSMQVQEDRELDPAP